MRLLLPVSPVLFLFACSTSVGGKAEAGVEGGEEPSDDVAPDDKASPGSGGSGFSGGLGGAPGKGLGGAGATSNASGGAAMQAVPTCGDGEVNQDSEDCDDGGESKSCTSGCKISTCGDGVTNVSAGEICDDGAENGDASKCDSSCLFECVRECPVRVDLEDGDDQNDGATWTSAFASIEAAALSQAFKSGGDVWVKQGTSASFMMQPGVRIYGGFEGVEKSLVQRSPEGRTIVDNEDRTGSAVVAARNATLNGFNIIGGNANQEGAFEKVDGGGILAIGSTNLVIESCDVEGNRANEEGGGLYIDGGSVIIRNSLFKNNGAASGGGVFVRNGGELTVTGTRFEANYLIEETFRTLVGGGALFLEGTEASISDSVFIGNKSFDADGDFAFGKGSAVYTTDGSRPEFRDVSFHANEYGLGPSVIEHDESYADYANCSFTGHGTYPNTALMKDTGATGSTLTNCTFADNEPNLIVGHAGTTVSNTIFYLPDANAGIAVSSGVVQNANCHQTADGRLGSDLDVLVRPYPDTNADGIPETYLNQTVENPCFAVIGSDVAADAADLEWDQMSTAESGCRDFSPVDVGRHYSTPADAPVCL